MVLYRHTAKWQADQAIILYRQPMPIIRFLWAWQTVQYRHLTHKPLSHCGYIKTNFPVSQTVLLCIATVVCIQAFGIMKMQRLTMFVFLPKMKTLKVTWRKSRAFGNIPIRAVFIGQVHMLAVTICL